MATGTVQDVAHRDARKPTSRRTARDLALSSAYPGTWRRSLRNVLRPCVNGPSSVGCNGACHRDLAPAAGTAGRVTAKVAAGAVEPDKQCHSLQGEVSPLTHADGSFGIRYQGDALATLAAPSWSI